MQYVPLPFADPGESGSSVPMSPVVIDYLCGKMGFWSSCSVRENFAMNFNASTTVFCFTLMVALPVDRSVSGMLPLTDGYPVPRSWGFFDWSDVVFAYRVERWNTDTLQIDVDRSFRRANASER